MINTYIRDISEALAQGHAALMVGAGFSKNAKKITATDKRFLDWKELSDLFYTSLYGEEGGPGKEYCSSLRLAQEVETISGRPRLDSILKEAAPDLEYAPTEIYTNLMDLPWTDVFTTNYDTLLERAADTVTSRRYNVVTSQEDLVNSNDVPRIIKLHGSFPSHRPFIITEEDYRTYPVRFAPLVNTVQQSLLENVFCMVGFSCEDPNFLKWIGWIRDNLGKSSSQKIYMISVTPILEAKAKLLFEQNIVVVDLTRVWGDKDVAGRIATFIDALHDKVKNKEAEDTWFSVNKLPQKWQDTIEGRISLLQKLNETYPGWIVLPWKMKNRVSYILNELDRTDVLEKASWQEQVAYMYEYTKFLDIAGRPILFQITEKFWKILKEIDKHLYQVDEKKHSILLQLLRAFREQAQWEKYDECLKILQMEKLNYEEKQFFLACEWWKALYRFEFNDLSANLEQWELSKGDLYWPLIKGSMYAIIGEVSKAENLLMENLISLRKNFLRSEKREYLASIEESCVSLINFIRQRNFSFEDVEECTCKSYFSWWEENDKYCLALNSVDKNQVHYEEKMEFDLSISRTTHWGRNNTKLFYAMEYLRFLEQSGHPFRLGNVTNTKGLEGTITRLVFYYPHWCLMQSIMAQDTKHLDLFYGRVKLSSMTWTEVDKIVDEYVGILNKLIENINPSLSFSEVSVYEYAATVIPQLLARLVYKCSLDMLDAVLEVALKICRSNVKRKFIGMKELVKGVIHSYSVPEQMERLDKILLFPIETDRVCKYEDPIHEVGLPSQKVKLADRYYDEVMYGIRNEMAGEDPERKKCACDRWIALYQIIELREGDKKQLLQILKENMKVYREILYFLNPEDKRENAKEIFNNIISGLEQDAGCLDRFFSGTQFGNVFSVLAELDSSDIEYQHIFDVLKKYVEKNKNWMGSQGNFEAQNRIRMSFLLFILVFIKKMDASFSEEQKKAALDLEKIIETIYKSPALELFKADCLERQEEHISLATLDVRLWLSDEEDIVLIKDYYDTLESSGIPMENFRNSYEFWNNTIRFVVYKMLGEESNLLETLRVCWSLLQFRIPENEELLLLTSALERLTDATVISEDEDEQKALYKICCRIESCKIAHFLFKKGSTDEAVLHWKKIGEDPNEFMELRNIWC